MKPSPDQLDLLNLEHLVGSITDGLMAIDRNWQITYINPKAAHNGYREPHDLIGKNLWVEFPQLVGTSIERQYRKAMEERVPLQFEMKGVVRDQWYLISIYPSDNGITIYWIDYSQYKSTVEVTQRLLVENQHQRALLEAIFDADPGPLAVLVGPVLRYSFANPAYRFLYPDCGHELVGSCYRDCGLYEGTPNFLEDLQSVYMTGKPFIRERVEHTFPDGTRRIFTLQARRIDWEDQQPAVLLLMWDITEQSQAHKQAQQEHAQLKAVLEALPVGVAILDEQGGQIRANSTFDQIWGEPRPHAESVDDYTAYRAWWANTGNPVQPEDWASAQASQKGETVLGQEMRIRRFDGSDGYVLNSGVPIRDAQGKITGSVVAMLDITERKRTEEALAAAHRQNQNIIDNTPALVYAFDLDERFIMANSTLAELLNSTPEKLMGKRRHEFMPEEDAVWHEANDRRAIEAGKAVEFEESSQLDDRTITWLTTKFPLRDAQGKIYAVAGISTDFSAHKRVEAALQESNQKYQELVRYAPAGIYEVDFRTRRYTSVNDVICEITGYSREELLTMDAFELLDEAGQKLFQQRIQQWLAGEKPSENIEYRAKTKDGRLIDTLLNVTFRRDEAGRPLGATVVAIDITERKRAEEARLEALQVAAQSEARYRALAEQSPDAILVNLNEQFVYANPAAARLLAAGSPQALLGRSPFDILEPEYHAAIHQRIERILHQPGTYPLVEVVWRRLDGSTVPVEVSSIAIRWNGKPAIQMIVRDITERKLKEVEARSQAIKIELQRRLLEQREQDRMQIARDLHDGPVQEILAAMYALKEMIVTDGDNHLANGIREVVDTLSTQLSELRNYASELRPPILMQFGLAKAIQAHLESYQAKYPNIQVRLEVSQTGELLPDPMRLALFRIYQEAMNNIARHCQQAEVRVYFRKTEEIASLEVMDDGPGFDLPEDWLALARAGHLGLVGMRERAEAIGGTLAVNSKPGKGTTIRVEAPLGEIS